MWLMRNRCHQKSVKEGVMQVNERLIVAADYNPGDFGGRQGVRKKVLELAREIEGTGVYLKLNSVLRACGYSLIDELHNLGLKVFADLKLIDIPNTMGIDADLLNEVKPEIVTVMSLAEVDGLLAVRKKLDINIEVLGVTILTSLDEEKCHSVFGCSTKTGVLRFARLAQLAKLTGLVLSPRELKIVTGRPELTMTYNTPGIRPEWYVVNRDDQSRTMTPREAISAGADRIIIGRPITQAGKKPGKIKSPREAIEFTLEEIEEAIRLR